MQLLSADQHALIESHLAALLKCLFRADPLAPLNRVISAYVRSPGKRIRPQLCLWTFAQLRDAQADASPPLSLLDLACAWELFHAFLLAHDDIIDDAAHRRGQPSLHVRLAGLDGHSRRFGSNLGIVAGDLLFSAAMRIWHEVDLPDPTYRRALKLFSRIACTTGFGQAIDICQSHMPIDNVPESLLLREYDWKTAAYTFEGPMLTGALLAGADDSAMSPLARYALTVGQAYQLQNDLLDLSCPAHVGSDIAQGKRTVALLRARSRLSSNSRREFDRTLLELQHNGLGSLDRAESLRRHVIDHGGAEQTRELIESLLAQAESTTRDPAMPGKLAQPCLRLLDQLRASYFSPR